MDLLLTREESGVSNSGFSEKNSTSLSFLVKSLMSFSISGKLRCGVGVNFKPLLKIWICKWVELTLDKFRTLRWIISSSWLSLILGNEGKNYLLRNWSHVFDLVRNILRIWYNYCVFILLVIIIGLTLVKVFNFHCFKSFFLSLIIWSYLTKNDRFLLLSTFVASTSVGVISFCHF